MLSEYSCCCETAACGTRNRFPAAYCAQCGQPLRPTGNPSDNAFTLPGGTVKPVDCFADVVTWGLILAGSLILIGAFLNVGQTLFH